MNSIRSKHIVAGLVAVFVLIFLFLQGNEDYSYDHTGLQSQTQGPTPSQLSNYSNEIEKAHPSSLSRPFNPTNPQRNEIMQAKVKGYRESTYWGEQTPIHEKTQDMSDYEFDRYVDEVQLDDADVYWGASY